MAGAMRSGWLALGLIVMLAGGAGAQSGSGLFGGGGGAVVPVGAFGDDFNEGPSYGLWMGMGLYDHGDLMLRLQQSFVDQKGEGGDVLFGDTDVTVTTITVGPKFYFTPPAFVARPFVGLELGYTGIENDDGGSSVLEDDERFGLNLGGGIDLGRQSWSLGFDVRYHRSFGSGNQDDLAYVMPMGSFTFRLLP